jgi:hypothetical protein
MSSTKKGISALEMQRQIGHKRYGTIWRLIHKIREEIGQRDGLYPLNGQIEFEEGYFKQATSEQTNLKRVRQRQSNVAVMSKSTPLVDIENSEISSHTSE